MTGVLERRWSLTMKRLTGRMPGNDNGRYWSHTISTRETQRFLANHKKQGRGRISFQVSKGTQLCQYLDFGLKASRTETIHFYYFKLPSLRYFVVAILGNEHKSNEKFHKARIDTLKSLKICLQCAIQMLFSIRVLICKNLGSRSPTLPEHIGVS